MVLADKNFMRGGDSVPLDDYEENYQENCSKGYSECDKEGRIPSAVEVGYQITSDYICEKYNLVVSEAKAYMDKYWK